MNEGTDLAVKVTVPAEASDVAGAVLMERLGSYSEEPVVPSAGASQLVALTFYPGVEDAPTDEELLALLRGIPSLGRPGVERQEVPRDWVEGWKDHFPPITIGQVRVRPPWEAPAEPGGPLVDEMIDPGMAFGTGSHATTKSALILLQEDAAQSASPGFRGRLVDVGTGSGILAIAAAKLGWAPVIAFDDDPVAVDAARVNIAANGVCEAVELSVHSLSEAPLEWFEGSTVLANLTLGPVMALLDRLSTVRVGRLIVAGVLAGRQEEEVVSLAQRQGLVVGQRFYEGDWVGLELLPRPRTERA